METRGAQLSPADCVAWAGRWLSAWRANTTKSIAIGHIDADVAEIETGGSNFAGRYCRGSAGDRRGLTAYSGTLIIRRVKSPTQGKYRKYMNPGARR
jgi:hypothetical protein